MSTWSGDSLLREDGNSATAELIASWTLASERLPRIMSYALSEEQIALAIWRPRPVFAPVIKIASRWAIVRIFGVQRVCL